MGCAVGPKREECDGMDSLSRRDKQAPVPSFSQAPICTKSPFHHLPCGQGTSPYMHFQQLEVIMRGKRVLCLTARSTVVTCDIDYLIPSIKCMVSSLLCIQVYRVRVPSPNLLRCEITKKKKKNLMVPFFLGGNNNEDSYIN